MSNYFESISQLLHVALIFSIGAITLFSQNKISIIIGLILSIIIAVSWAISNDRCMLNDLSSKLTNYSYDESQSRFAKKYLPFDSKYIRPLLYFSIFILFWKIFE